MSYYRSDEYPESSPQGTLKMMQHDLQGHMLGTEEKIDRLQIQIELLVVEMNNRTSTKKVEEDSEYMEDENYKESVIPGSTSKGMYRDPLHAAMERQKLLQKQNKVEDFKRTGVYKRSSEG